MTVSASADVAEKPAANAAAARSIEIRVRMN
jgi:hypothetical protein